MLRDIWLRAINLSFSPKSNGILIIASSKNKRVHLAINYLLLINRTLVPKACSDSLDIVTKIVNDIFMLNCGFFH